MAAVKEARDYQAGARSGGPVVCRRKVSAGSPAAETFYYALEHTHELCG